MAETGLGAGRNNVVATDAELIATGTTRSQPAGVDRDRVQPVQFRDIPFLAEIRDRLSPQGAAP